MLVPSSMAHPHPSAPDSGHGSSSATIGRHRISASSDLPLDADAVAEGRPAAQPWVEEMPELPAPWEDTDDWGRSSHTDPTSHIEIPRSKTELLVQEEAVVGDFGDSLGCFPVPAPLPSTAAVSLDG